MLIWLHANAQLPKVCSGKIIRHSLFHSQFVAPRNIDVWLPANYQNDTSFGVLYMHDGQMLFDSTLTFNKQEWGVDETLTQLYLEADIQPIIVVGIWNTTQRRQEYFPEKPFYQIKHPLQDSIQQDIGGAPLSENYLQFIVTELKPFIDSVYKTQKRRSHTYIAGASSGALISWYALCEFPQVFNGAACLSNHWTGSVKRNTTEIPDLFNLYLKSNLPTIPSLLYLDCGTEGLDAWYEYGFASWKKTEQQLQQSATKILSNQFQHANHSEKDWAQRLRIPLQFLLQKE